MFLPLYIMNCNSMNYKGCVSLKCAVVVSASQVNRRKQQSHVWVWCLITYKEIKGASNGYFSERYITH